MFLVYQFGDLLQLYVWSVHKFNIWITHFIHKRLADILLLNKFFKKKEENLCEEAIESLLLQIC